jgi:hypothetical protein
VHPLPVIGRQLRSVRDLSKAAATISGAGGDALEEVSALLSTADFGPADRAPLVRKLSDLASRTDQRLEGISLGPHRGLIGPLAEAHDELADQLTELRAGLRNGTQAATAVADLLARECCCPRGNWSRRAGASA